MHARAIGRSAAFEDTRKTGPELGTLPEGRRNPSPDWVKVAVAPALGLGTMVDAASELVAMATILAADRFCLPVSTTHVLRSGVAGTMAANRSGSQVSTLRSLALAWVLTLPCSIAVAASLYWLFRRL